jgi:phosphoglycolate phosphatase
MDFTYENIIWDWNGTLLNDIQLTIDIVNGMLPKHGDTQLDLKSYRSIFGFPILNYYKNLGFNFELESFDDLTKKFIEQYNAEVRQFQLHSEVFEVLNHFKTQGKNQCILTAAFKKDVIELLDHYELTSYFSAIEGLDNYKAASKVERGKALLKDNQLNSETCIMFGDTMHDFEVAKAIGIECKLIANGHQSKERLINHVGEENVFDNISELLNFNL